MLSAKGKRKRLIFHMFALCFGIPAVSLDLQSIYCIRYYCRRAGSHGDSFAWTILLVIAYIILIGVVVSAIPVAMMYLAARVKE